MKKQLRIVLTFLLVAAFFITAEIIPEITNHLTDQKTTNAITVSHDSTQTTPTKVNLSYKERLAIFSSETIAASEILTTAKAETLTEYDESFFEKLQKQLHKLYSFHLIPDDLTVKDLENMFQSATYLSIRNYLETDSFCVWELSFLKESNKQSYSLRFDVEQEKIYYVSMGNIPIKEILTKSDPTQYNAVPLTGHVAPSRTLPGNTRPMQYQAIPMGESKKSLLSEKINRYAKRLLKYYGASINRDVSAQYSSEDDYKEAHYYFTIKSYKYNIPVTIITSQNYAGIENYLTFSFGNFYSDFMTSNGTSQMVDG